MLSDLQKECDEKLATYKKEKDDVDAKRVQFNQEVQGNVYDRRAVINDNKKKIAELTDFNTKEEEAVQVYLAQSVITTNEYDAEWTSKDVIYQQACSKYKLMIEDEEVRLANVSKTNEEAIAKIAAEDKIIEETNLLIKQQMKILQDAKSRKTAIESLSGLLTNELPIEELEPPQKRCRISLADDIQFN